VVRTLDNFFILETQVRFLHWAFNFFIVSESRMM
jgi:hypothetical protein